MCRCRAAVARPHVRPFSRSMGETSQPSRRFAVEVQPRWRDVLCDRWPVVVQASARRIAVELSFIGSHSPMACRRAGSGTSFGFGEGLWSPRLDLAPQPEMLGLLADRTGLGSEIAAMTIGVEWRPLQFGVALPRRTWPPGETASRLAFNIARLVSLTMRGRTFDGDGGWPRRWPAAGMAASFLTAALAAFLRWLLSISALSLRSICAPAASICASPGLQGFRRRCVALRA